jgi:hypothetical protein
MKGPQDLIAHEDKWVTKMGLSFGGERVVYRGKDLFSELKTIRWVELLLFGITGRRFEENQILLFEGLWTLGSSYPDPRIWNNRIASLAGTARTTTSLGIGAAIAVSEASIYGRIPDIRAIDFLIRTARKLDQGIALYDIIRSELKKYRVLPGFGRPMVNGDERIRPGRELAERLGYENGKYFRLVFEIEETLTQHRYRMKMNAAGLGAALAADQGLDPIEYYFFLTPGFLAGMLPCYIDALDHAEATFLPLSCERIEYTGREKRAW